jgi:5-methylcytosine-specific restriction endonuclease McrA
MLQCKHCGVELTADNTYKRSGRKADFPVGYYRYCKSCYGKQRHRRIKQNRTNIIEKKGGKCCRCGYNKCEAALELHHLDPSIKDHKTTRHLRHITDPIRLQAELDKCILLCANCHREAHSVPSLQ